MADINIGEPAGGARQALAEEDVCKAVKGVQSGEGGPESRGQMLHPEGESMGVDGLRSDQVGIPAFIGGTDSRFVLKSNFAVKIEAESRSLRRKPEGVVVPGIRAVKIHQVNVAPEGKAIHAGIGGVQAVDIAADIARETTGIRTEYPVDLIDISILEIQSFDRGVAKRQGVVGLFILPPADVSYEGCVIIDDPLAAELESRVKAPVL